MKDRNLRAGGVGFAFSITPANLSAIASDDRSEVDCPPKRTVNQHIFHYGKRKPRSQKRSQEAEEGQDKGRCRGSHTSGLLTHCTGPGHRSVGQAQVWFRPHSGVARHVGSGPDEFENNDMSTPSSHPRDPLHGITLESIVNQLVQRHGWSEMGARIPIRCFLFNPTVKSSLTFLRKTPWARAKVEDWFISEL
jgi:hypothetical protein